MVRVGDNSIFRFLTAGKPTDTNFFEPKRQGFGTSCVNPKNPAYAFTGNLYLDPKETNSTYGLPHSLQPYHQPPFTSPITSLEPKASKKFLVFDRSKNGTKLLFGPPMQNPEKQSGDFDANRDEFGITPKLDLNCPVLEEEEHHVVEEESEMHEDTEEINALLYSDDSGDYGSDEDDVTSTGHTPSTMLGLCWKHKQFDELKDESSHPYKRQKLLSGADAVIPSIKDKISQTLIIMEGIVPGVKGKDPIVILNGAIEYLKAMKLRAQVIGKNIH